MTPLDKLWNRRPVPALCDAMGGQDHGIETAAERVALIDALKQFPERERRIVVLHFFHDQAQQLIAASVGVSQMHVSRLLSRCLAERSSRPGRGHGRASRRGCVRQVTIGTSGHGRRRRWWSA
ncbi:sigma-70 family RNA polymerase sigma factor [Streptomyces sp. NPDC014805]|uniref:sigma-70 family RNA polymerase sigma factor n=1 Tax=Streptomyces sp. NPDC014805 TaxID=3364919 RepID=UPI0036FFA574